jgi:hypothetical protein
MTGKIRARFIVEAQGQPESVVENTLKKHVEGMKMMEEIEVTDVQWEPTEEVDGLFSSLADVGVAADSFEAFFAALLGFAPTAVIVEEPQKVEVEMREIQNVTNDLVQMFHALAQANAKLRLALRVEKVKKEGK